MLAKIKTRFLQPEFMRIMAYASGCFNDETYACILSSWQMGLGDMPDDLGLGAVDYKALLGLHFPQLEKTELILADRKNTLQRDDERHEVYKLLISYRAGHSVSEAWMAKIVAQACQGQDHLWQDMGLWSRGQLSELLQTNFPLFAKKNTQNMKWKKFIYKQLCLTEGIYVCRAPSCEVCDDYDDCFGDES